MQKTAYELRISDWSSDVCSSDLIAKPRRASLLAQIGNTEMLRQQKIAIAPRQRIDAQQQRDRREQRHADAQSRQQRPRAPAQQPDQRRAGRDRKSTRLNSSH